MLVKMNLNKLNIGIGALAGALLWFIWQAATTTPPETQSILARFFISKLLFGASSAAETFFTNHGRDWTRTTNPIVFLPISVLFAVAFAVLGPLHRMILWFVTAATWTITAIVIFETQRLIIPYGGPFILITFLYVSGTLINLESEKIERSRKLARDLQIEAEDERKRIAKDLHDEVLPSLSRVMRMTDQLQEENQESQLPQEMRSRLESTVMEMRSVINDLHPAILENLGLSAGLQHLVNRIGLDTKIQSTFTDESGGVTLPPFESLCVFRIAQEALNNVEKHSGASHVVASLEKTSGNLCLKISDDGTGGVKSKADSHGLKNMQDRARLIGGKVEWKAPDKFSSGTMMVLTLPLSSDSTNPKGA